PPPPRKPRLKIEDHSKKHSVDLCGLRCAPFRMPSLLLKADISGYIPRCRRGVRFTPKADICSATRDVCFGPKADIGSAQAHVWLGPKAASLFDHLVGASKDRRRNRKAYCLGCLKIDHQVVFRCRLHWQISGLLAF